MYEYGSASKDISSLPTFWRPVESSGSKDLSVSIIAHGSHAHDLRILQQQFSVSLRCDRVYAVKQHEQPNVWNKAYSIKLPKQHLLGSFFSWMDANVIHGRHNETTASQ